MFGRFVWAPLTVPIGPVPGVVRTPFTVDITSEYELSFGLTRFRPFEEMQAAVGRPGELLPVELAWSVFEDGRLLCSGDTSVPLNNSWSGGNAVGRTLVAFVAEPGKKYELETRLASSLFDLQEGSPRVSISADTSRPPFHSRFFIASYLMLLGAVSGALGLLVLLVFVVWNVRFWMQSRLTPC